MVLAPPDIMNCNHNKEAFTQHKKKNTFKVNKRDKCYGIFNKICYKENLGKQISFLLDTVYKLNVH